MADDHHKAPPKTGGIWFLFQKRFGPLFILLQTGTFNDNALKNALIALITFGGIVFLADLPSAIRVPVAAFIFTGPFLLICAIAGQIADKIDRGVILRWIKRAEVLIMALAAIGFWQVNIHILAVALGLMGLQSGFFSPTKNAVLPQWLTDKELIRGNAILNGFVFVFVLVGQVVGTLIVLQTGGPKIIAALLFALAIIGLIASEFCPPAPAPRPSLKINFNPLTATWTVLKDALDAPAVLRPMLGIAWFYGLSAVFVTTFPDYIASYMRYDANVLIVVLVISTLAILLGSLIVMLIGHLKIWGPEAVGLSALGISGVTVFMAALILLPSPVYIPQNLTGDTQIGNTLGTVSEFLENPNTPIFLATLIGASVCNGLFVVPLQAMAQRRAEPHRRARLMSAGAVLLNLFVNVVTFALIGIAALTLPAKAPFMIIVACSLIVALYALYRTFNPTFHPNHMDT